MKLKFDTHLCTECHSCEMMCSMVRFKVYNIKKAALRTKTRFPDSPELDYCRQCKNAPCMDVCPVEAITKDGDVYLLNESICIQCGQCQEACPYDAIFITPEGQFFKCDSCQGKYLCTTTCATQALTADKEEV